jgi:hypothetical protein
MSNNLSTLHCPKLNTFCFGTVDSFFFTVIVVLTVNSFLWVAVVAQYLNCVTFSNDLFVIFMSWLFQSSLWRDTNICLVFSAFNSRPVSLLPIGFEVMLPSPCSFIVDVSCSTLHVSTYMAIFRCVWCFTFYIPEGICFPVFCCLSLHVVTLCTFSFVFSCCVVFFVSFLILVCVCVCVCLLVFSCCLSVLCNKKQEKATKTAKQILSGI